MREVVVLVVFLSVTIASVYGAVTPNYMKYELLYSSKTVSWGTAWATCQEHSQSDLVDIKDSVKNKALYHFFSTPEASDMKGPMWIGLHYVKSETGAEFQWSDCQSVNETVPWLTGEPSAPEVSSCITAGRKAFMARTHNCSSSFVFVCQNIKGDCSYTSFKDEICDTSEGRVVLEGQLSQGECRDRCSMDKNGSDLCWAFEREKSSSKCTLIFSPSPYACESQVSLKDTDSEARNCFEYITGKKEKVVESNAPVSACVSATTTTTTVAAATTTAPSTTTSITTTPTTTEADPTQSTTSSTAGVESTHTEASVVTTTTTAITTMTVSSEPSAVMAASMSTASTTESPAVTTATTSATTTIPSTATTTASDTDTPTSTPVSSTPSTATGGTFSPALDTFLSRLEAAHTSPMSASTPTVTSLGRHVHEVCVAIQTFTVEERKKRTDDIVTDLTLDKKNLSSYRRKKSSAEDERPSAQNVGGGVAIMLLVTAALIIILPDCSSILMHVVHVNKKK